MSNAKTYLITNPCLLPVSFAQRITASQLAILLKHFNLPCKYSSFAYAPYSNALKCQLYASPQFSKKALHLFRNLPLYKNNTTA